jgi:ribosomal protein S18 acetylase RimI-like enzyme
MNQLEIETAARHAWPALQEVELDCGVLRFARGVSRRANFFNPFPAFRHEPEALVRLTERFFNRYELPSIVRIVAANSGSTGKFAELDACLAAQNYILMTTTRVMTRSLPWQPLPDTTPENARISAVDLDSWLRCWHWLTGRTHAELVVHRAMLGRLQGKHTLLVQSTTSGQWLSCGMAVVVGNLLGIFGIATAPEARGQGLATNLVRQLLSWGIHNSCNTAYLQVECANAPAIAVYEKLGFAEAYRYWYREKPFNQLHKQETE